MAIRVAHVAAWGCVALGFTLHARPAAASEEAIAEALFQQGRTLLEQGNLAPACAKFQESQRLEPKLGTLLNLAVCHEQLGKTASAWAEFTQAVWLAKSAHREDRERFAEEHLAALTPRLSHLTVEIGEPAPGETVELDGVPLGSAALHAPLPVDPGRHEVSALADGRQPFRTEIDVDGEARTVSVTLPRLTEAEAAAPASPLAAPPAAAPRSSVASPPRREPPSRARKHSMAPALAAFGAGLVAAGVGTVAGLRAFAKKSDAEPECDGSACSRRGLALYDEAKTAADVATVAFVLAGVAGGVGLYFTLRPLDGGGPIGARLPFSTGAVSARGEF